MSGRAGAELAAALGYARPPAPSWPVRLVRSAASTAPAARLLARTLRPVDTLLARRRPTLSASGLVARLPTVALTTTGARSGRPRTVPLIPVVTDEVFAVLGTNFGGERTPAWALNLLTHAEAELAYGDRRVAVRARPLQGAERHALLAAATRLYPGFGRYVARAAHREVLVFALEPSA
ncbi:MAG TPA: nitroreductase family deazaflavin-dependent oxidoreductase [Kineosporiaceae bacterium]|nr:nitroreductase family deazaflavin-dependent oxidoreductase [Kineosporiaceae bacterium]